MKFSRLLLQLIMGLSTIFFNTLVQANAIACNPRLPFCVTHNESFPPQMSISSTGIAFVKYTITVNSTDEDIGIYLITKKRTDGPVSDIPVPIPGVSVTGDCLINKDTGNTCTLTLQITGSGIINNAKPGFQLCKAKTDKPGHITTICINPDQNLEINVIGDAPNLQPSTPDLALSVTGLPFSSGLPSGQARVVTITNQGATTASNLSVKKSGLPTGTSVVQDTCSGTTLPSGSSCIIQVMPGSVATDTTNNLPCATAPGINPVTPGIITVSAGNVNLASTTVEVLGYGCIYQGGYIYSIIETPNNAPRIGGAVVSTSDQARPVLTAGGLPQAGTPGAQASVSWSSNGSPYAPYFGDPTANANVSYDLIPGINELSTSSTSAPTFIEFAQFYTNFYSAPANPFDTTSFAACNGSSDGKCNTSNILKLYNTLTTNYKFNNPPYIAETKPTNKNLYAAGLCAMNINNYSDWYLPASCELVSNSGFCASGTQSIAENLPFLLGIPENPEASTSCNVGTGCLAGFYWSSTEKNGNAAAGAYYGYFSVTSTFSNVPNPQGKSYPLGVRCSRALT